MIKADISGGPSKWDFIMSFADGTARDRKVVRFHPKGKIRIPNSDWSPPFLDVVVNTVEREDGSGESWNFTAYLLKGGYSLRDPRAEGASVRGYYHTGTRKGHLEIQW